MEQKTLKHPLKNEQHLIGVRILADVSVTFHVEQERGVADFPGIFTIEIWLEKHFRASTFSLVEQPLENSAWMEPTPSVPSSCAQESF